MMATKKRKTKAKTTTRRRRSISGVPARRRRRSVSGVGSKTDFTLIVAAVAGAVIARVASSKLKDKVNPKMMSGAQIAAGVVIPMFVKNKMVQGAALGMIINGAVSLLNQVGVIGQLSGIGADDMQLEYLSGTDELNSLAGEDDDAFAGIDDGTMSGNSSDRLSILAGVNDFESELSGLEDDDNYN